MNKVVLACAATILSLITFHTRTMEIGHLEKAALKIHKSSIINGRRIASSFKHKDEQEILKKICVLKYGIRAFPIEYFNDQSELATTKKNTTKNIVVKADAYGVHFSLEENPEKIIHSHKPDDWIPTGANISILNNLVTVTRYSQGCCRAYFEDPEEGYVYLFPTFGQYLRKKPKSTAERFLCMLAEAVLSYNEAE